MTKPVEVKNTEIAYSAAQEVYSAFLGNTLDRVEGEVGKLTDRMADESNPEAILSLQKNLKRMQRRWSVLRSIADGIRPLQVRDILNGIAEPEVREELQPMFDMIEDLRDALNLTTEDAIRAAFRTGARHE
jgi:hypothetical protein